MLGVLRDEFMSVGSSLRMKNTYMIHSLTGLFAGMAYGVKQTIRSIDHRAELRILEVLSSGNQLSRNEIYELVRNDTILFRTLFRLMPERYTDALASLTLSGKIMIANGKYTLIRD